MDDKFSTEPPKVGELMKGRVRARDFDDQPDPRSLPQTPKQPPVTPKPEAPPEPKPEKTPDLHETVEEYKLTRTKLARELAEEKLRKAIARKERAESFSKFRKAFAIALLTFARKTPGAIYRSLRPMARRAAAHRRATAVTATALVVLILALSVWPGPKIRADRAAKTSGVAVQKAPEFPTIAPQGDVSTTSGGKIAYDEIKKVASYTDKIGDVGITVSQQVLPPVFAAKPDEELAKFAEQIYAKEKIETGSTTAYIGASIKGPQTIVLVKNRLLIFITTDKKVETPAITSYIETLQ